MENITNADVTGAPRELKAQLAFMTWLQDTHPDVFAAALREGAELVPATGVGGFFDSIGSAISKINFGKLADGAVKAGTGLLALKSQRDILKLNLARAKAGEPPLDAAAYGQAPVIRTQIDLQPELANGLAATFGGVKLPMLIGLGALLYFVMKRGRR